MWDLCSVVIMCEEDLSNGFSYKPKFQQFNFNIWNGMASRDHCIGKFLGSYLISLSQNYINNGVILICCKLHDATLRLQLWWPQLFTTLQHCSHIFCKKPSCRSSCHLFSLPGTVTFFPIDLVVTKRSVFSLLIHMVRKKKVACHLLIISK